MIILHIVIWYINDNITRSVLLLIVTSNKLGLLVYLLENMSQRQTYREKEEIDR